MSDTCSFCDKEQEEGKQLCRDCGFIYGTITDRLIALNADVHVMHGKHLSFETYGVLVAHCLLHIASVNIAFYLHDETMYGEINRKLCNTINEYLFADADTSNTEN